MLMLVGQADDKVIVKTDLKRVACEVKISFVNTA
jgi:hypothetical protein